jgi:hypothetical protein
MVHVSLATSLEVRSRDAEAKLSGACGYGWALGNVVVGYRAQLMAFLVVGWVVLTPAWMVV